MEIRSLLPLIVLATPLQAAIYELPRATEAMPTSALVECVTETCTVWSRCRTPSDWNSGNGDTMWWDDVGSYDRGDIVQTARSDDPEQACRLNVDGQVSVTGLRYMRKRNADGSGYTNEMTSVDAVPISGGIGNAAAGGDNLMATFLSRKGYSDATSYVNWYCNEFEEPWAIGYEPPVRDREECIENLTRSMAYLRVLDGSDPFLRCAFDRFFEFADSVNSARSLYRLTWLAADEEVPQEAPGVAGYIDIISGPDIRDVALWVVFQNGAKSSVPNRETPCSNSRLCDRYLSISYDGRFPWVCGPLRPTLNDL